MLASFLSVTQNLGYPALFGLVCAEALGVPLPGETALITAAILASQHRLSIVLVIVVAAAAAIIGDNIGYQIGRRGGRRLLERPGRFHERRLHFLAIADPFFAKHGAKAVFLGRWIAGLRVWASWLAGASEMHWLTFAFWNAAGGIAWATSVGLAAYFGGKGLVNVITKVGIYGAIAAGAAIAIVLLVVVVRRRRRAA